MQAMQLGRGATIIVIGGLVVAAAGCESSDSSYQVVRLAPMGRPFESDIPVPVGFSFVERASEDCSTGVARLYLRHLYAGNARKLNVRNFYREQMPLARWVKVSEGNIKGEYRMRFVKGHEACTVLIRDRRGMKSGTEVQVVITQEQRGTPPPTARSQR